jgi:Mn-containing catalase
MMLRIDKLAIELPAPAQPSPNSAAAVQELLGGKFGEMSTLMNATFRSFNLRGRASMRPFYDLTANIAAEEFSHIELVSYSEVHIVACAKALDKLTGLDVGELAASSHRSLAISPRDSSRALKRCADQRPVNPEVCPLHGDCGRETSPSSGRLT